jgi:hypothetical protein
MSPGKDPVEPVIIQLPFQLFQPAFIEGGEETGFQGYTVHLQFFGARQEIFHGHILCRRFLVRIDIAKETVVTVAVNSNFHCGLHINILFGLLFELYKLCRSDSVGTPEWVVQ